MRLATALIHVRVLSGTTSLISVFGNASCESNIVYIKTVEQPIHVPIPQSHDDRRHKGHNHLDALDRQLQVLLGQKDYLRSRWFLYRGLYGILLQLAEVN